MKTSLSCIMVLLNKVHDQFLAHSRVEQSGFTPGRSTIDWIFTLNTIIQSRKEFQKPLWIAFVDLKAALDSVDHMALWKLLRSFGLHSKVVDLVEGLYTNTCSCVNVGGMMSDLFALTRKWCLARFQNCTWPVPRANWSYDGTHSTPRYDRYD